MGFPVILSEIVNNATTRLTHLDLGNTHLQLVEPLTPEHPIHAWLAKNNGPGLHYFCLRVESADEPFGTPAVPPGEPRPYEGTLGKRVLFLDRDATQGVPVELTGR